MITLDKDEVEVLLTALANRETNAEILRNCVGLPEGERLAYADIAFSARELRLKLLARNCVVAIPKP